MHSFYNEQELNQLGLKSFGRNVLISRKASIYKPEKITIGNNVRIEDFCIITGPLKLGSFVHIAAGTFLRTCDEFPIIFEDATGTAPHVSIFTATDDYSGPFLFGPHFPNEIKNALKGTVHLKRFVLVGTQSVILPQVILEEGTAIGAMSLVTKNTKPWGLYFGVPARMISTRNSVMKEKFNKFIAESKQC